MALPSLADALIVIILLLPGFFSFTIIRWLGSYGSKLSEFQTTIASFSFSMVILFFYTMLTGLTNIDDIRDNFFIPQNYLILFGITVVVGFGIGMIAKRRRTNYSRLDTWQKVITSYQHAPWVLVFTKDGKEYKGIFFSAGVELGVPRDIAIALPKQILRNKENEITSEIEFGQQMVFKDSDVLRISFLENPSDAKNQATVNKES